MFAVILLLLLLSECMALTPITNDNIRSAVKLWVENDREALTKYGNISGWNTSQVTRLNYTCSGTVFNGDLSKWDTSKVTTLEMSKSNGWSGKSIDACECLPF